MLRVIITGPTCSGKGQVAFELAKRIGGEIISLDSMKVYRHMDIGTAKPSPEKRKLVRYHLIDVADPNEEFNLGRYVKEALQCVQRIEKEGKVALFAGGTPLYLWGLVRGFCEAPPGDQGVRSGLEKRAEAEGVSSLHRELSQVDPEAASKIHPHDKKRIIRALEVWYQTQTPFTSFWRSSSLKLPPGTYIIFGLRWPRQALYERINERVVRMVNEGLFEEAEEVKKRFEPLSRTAKQCIGYREIWEGRSRGLSKEEIIRLIQKNTRRFARKQGTWFRRFSEIKWIDANEREAEGIAEIMEKEIKGRGI